MKTRHRAEEGQRRRPEGLGWKRKRQRQSFLGGRKQKVNNGTSEMHQGMQHLVLLEMKISGRECTTCRIHIDTGIFFWLQGERQGHVGER